jgi:hypothetical protein
MSVPKIGFWAVFRAGLRRQNGYFGGLIAICLRNSADGKGRSKLCDTYAGKILRQILYAVKKPCPKARHVQ